MAIYIVGDVQGCWNSLQALITRLEFQPGRDCMFFVGDLVNRGPGSAQVLRWAMAQSTSVESVLGNHDLHLLAVAAGAEKRKPKDTFNDILDAPDRAEMLDWLRTRPMLIETEGVAVVHAGLHPALTMDDARRLARELEAAVRAPEAKSFFENMYGGDPCQWTEKLSGYERLRFATNMFTRMRLIADDGALNLRWKSEPHKAPPGLTPWFDVKPAPKRPPVLFGHWSALGLMVRPDVVGLDTGCVWGGSLTAIRLSDRKVFQVPAQDGALPIDE